MSEYLANKLIRVLMIIFRLQIKGKEKLPRIMSNTNVKMAGCCFGIVVPKIFRFKIGRRGYTEVMPFIFYLPLNWIDEIP